MPSAEHKSIAEYTEKYTQAFLEDTATLRLQRPERLVKATDHIPDMVRAIRRPGARCGYTYQSDGSIYYRISKFPGYGKLSHNDFSGIRAGARVDVDEYDKANARDFVLWKAPKNGEPFWDSADRTGSAGLAYRMFRDGDEVSGRDAGHSRRRRGPDVSASRKRDRAVGSDHFEALRALLAAFGISERRSAEDVEVGGQFLYAARSAASWAIAPEAVRYLLASVPYRKKLNFTFDGLKAAATAIDRLRNFKLRLETDKYPGRHEREAGGADRRRPRSASKKAWTTI